MIKQNLVKLIKTLKEINPKKQFQFQQTSHLLGMGDANIDAWDVGESLHGLETLLSVVSCKWHLSNVIMWYRFLILTGAVNDSNADPVEAHQELVNCHRLPRIRRHNP
jgi:hypothetical protein